jgi:methylglutaconyl-CoA hydratase
MLTISSQDSLYILTFASKKANALEAVIINELDTAIQSLSNDKTCHAILVQSEGSGIFSAGADLDEYRNGDEKSVQLYLYSLGSLLCAILNASKTVIVKVQGKAIGGALGLVAAADYSIGSDQATFRLPELQLGLAPSVISPVLQQRIGSGFLKTLSFSGTFFSAHWALTSGLLSEFVEESTLDSRAIELSSRIAGRSVDPVYEYKKSLTTERDEMLKKIKALSILNAKNIISAKNSGLFAKNP